MVTVAEIREGKTCPGCNSDCRNFVDEADTCIYNTFISSIFSEVIEDEGAKEVHYEPVKKKVIVVKMIPDNELTIKALNTLAGEQEC